MSNREAINNWAAAHSVNKAILPELETRLSAIERTAEKILEVDPSSTTKEIRCMTEDILDLAGWAKALARKLAL